MLDREVVAVVGTGDRPQWQFLYVDGYYVASMWGQATCRPPDEDGRVMVVIRDATGMRAFYHCHRVIEGTGLLPHGEGDAGGVFT